MIGKEIISQKALTLAELKNILQKREKEGELSFEQKTALEYAKEFGKPPVKKAQEAIAKITEMGLDEDTATSIVNVKPASKEQVNLIIEHSRAKLKDAQVKEVLDLCVAL